MSGNKKQVTMGGILSMKDGYGFKTVFPSPEIANKYKDMFRWILIHDGFPLIYQTGYYDKEEYRL